MGNFTQPITMQNIDELPNLTAREAYLVMLEFLRIEFSLAGAEGTVHLGGLLAEMELDETGHSVDTGALEQFYDAIVRVRSLQSNVPC